MKKLSAMFAAFLFVLPALAGCQQQPTPSRIVSERLIAQIDFSSWEKMSFRVSPDCRRIAYAATMDGKWFVVVDGQEEKTSYDNVSSPIFSPDSQRVAYTASSGMSRLVVVDSVESKQYDRVSSPVFSEDSQRLAYTAQEGDRWFLVVNGIEEKQFKGTMPSDPIFSPDFKRIAYVIEIGDKKSVVVDGQEGKPYDHVRRPVFSPNGQHVLYYANLRGSPSQGGKWFLVLDGKEIMDYDSCDDVTFSPDGERVAFIAEVNYGGVVVVDGIEGKHYGGIKHLIFSPDSRKFVYVAEVDNKEVVVVDGIEGKQYDRIGYPHFSTDSQVLAYTAKEGDRWFLVVNGVEEKQFDRMDSDPTFSPDCKRVAYDRSWSFLGLGEIIGYQYYMVVDGIKGERYDNVAHPVFSSDSQHVAYTAHDDQKVFVVVDGKEGKKYDILDISSNVPSQRWGYRELEEPAIGMVIYDSTDSLHYLAAKGNQVYLVEEVLN